ncbi:MAG: response regulator SirA [Chloroflexi bacterium GWB2_54_36]|nr:MAG: response regulator SirA [Chloroflexi bacterium GWB2_54_36]HBA91175.1 response regulator SirA [Anaerolineaceae bacterium]
MRQIHQVIKRTGSIVPFNPERITNAIYRAAVAVGGRDRRTAEALTQQVIQLLEDNGSPGQIPTVEEIQDAVEKILIENGHAQVAKAYILYRDERARARKERASRASTSSTNIPWEKIWRVLDWAVDHSAHTIAALNERIERNEILEIVHESEAAYQEDVDTAVELIAERSQTVRMVIVSGPSSSGKTTTTIKINQHLQHLGYQLVTLNVDNYFYDLSLHPKDEFGDYDFETPQALDLTLINQHLSRLVAGEEVQIPHYDFKSGARIAKTTPMRLAQNEILLIDSLHGLYEGMTSSVPPEQKFKLYLEPLLQIKDSRGNYARWTDIRLIRRMLRDAAHRAYDPSQTIEHWHYVRSSELRNIIPQIQQVDFIINSAMPYELPLYRHKMLDQFTHWAEQYQNDPLRLDAYERAVRVRDLLSEVLPYPDDSIVPPDSVIREFIGGSIYSY